MREKFFKRSSIKAKIREIRTAEHGDHFIAEYGINSLAEIPGVDTSKSVPKIRHQLRKRLVVVPEVIDKVTGINILERNIKSIIFTTDLAILTNSNADAVMAVYPFTPQLSITQAILSTATVPVFVGVGGGTTSGNRSLNIALQAELYGAYGVVVNTPMKADNINMISNELDIPVIATVASFKDDYMSKIKAGASILNVSAGKDTAELVKKIRETVGEEFPIIATGGPTDESIIKTIEAGANAITYSPPTTGEIFASIMEEYRKE